MEMDLLTILSKCDVVSPLDGNDVALLQKHGDGFSYQRTFCMGESVVGPVPIPEYHAKITFDTVESLIESCTTGEACTELVKEHGKLGLRVSENPLSHFFGIYIGEFGFFTEPSLLFLLIYFTDCSIFS
jgi:hypothetical protein